MKSETIFETWIKLMFLLVNKTFKKTFLIKKARTYVFRKFPWNLTNWPIYFCVSSFTFGFLGFTLHIRGQNKDRLFNKFNAIDNNRVFQFSFFICSDMHFTLLLTPLRNNTGWEKMIKVKHLITNFLHNINFLCWESVYLADGMDSV